MFYAALNFFWNLMCIYIQFDSRPLENLDLGTTLEKNIEFWSRVVQCFHFDALVLSLTLVYVSFYHLENLA